jgi:two-component system chemotaxis response regulator CheY
MATLLKVLVADNDGASLETLRKAIVSLGHECRTASNGREALEMHRRAHADVILSNWELPEMDGLELCRQTRIADDQLAYTHFILMTTFDSKEHFLHGMRAGADDYQTKPIDLDELQARLASAQRVVAVYRKLAEMNSALRRDSQASFKMARIDPLTKVANRLSLEEDLGAVWAQAERYGHRYSAVLCDIDWFKAYNDHYGHLAGDHALHDIADTMRRQLRQSDKIYRYGGEEFLLVLPEQSVSEACHVAERICRAVRERAIPTVAGIGIVTVSAGVAELNQALDENVDDWLNRADSALYEAKAKGRDRVEAALRSSARSPIRACLEGRSRSQGTT